MTRRGEQKHIGRFLSIYWLKYFVENHTIGEYSKIHRIQDVFAYPGG